MMQLCGAANRSGNPCGMPALDNGRCRIHGGLSTGPVNPAVKQGLYRKHLTGEEQELFDALKSDTKYEDLTTEVAMIRVMIHRCFGHVMADDSQNWRVPMQVMPQYIEKLLKALDKVQPHKNKTALEDSLDDAIAQMLSEEKDVQQLETDRAREEL
jgi:hypothetical protein